MSALILKFNWSPEQASIACDAVAARCGLSKVKVKDAMIKGAVWLVRAKTRKRLRRATSEMRAGDLLEIYYDADVLAVRAPQANCIYESPQYSVWNKPAGLLAQGNEYGDHCALLRQAELHFQSRRPVFLVHRLDREASGLMVVAHTPNAAARLSKLFHDGAVYKRYRVQVRGKVNSSHGEIDASLDGKSARTEFDVVRYDADSDVSSLDVVIHTGRLHQIRRHLASIGHGIMGDPKYGRDNKNTDGMRLIASTLRFRCPFAGRDVLFEIE